jgi:uncharacterized repeat protein (TIGR01451 family)
MYRLQHTRGASRLGYTRRTISRPRRLARALLALGLLVLIVPAGAQAATLTVTRTDDPAKATCTPASCSLRAAVAQADTDGANDTIVLPAGSYQLTGAAGGALSIDASMTIAGAGARSTTILPAPTDQLFRVEGGSVALDDLTLTGSTASTSGGVVEVTGSAGLTLLRDTLSNNDVLISSNWSGGAIYDGSTGQLLIESSTFSDNTGYNGGAIETGAPTTIVNSTFTGNHAGSPIYNGDAGAIEALSTLKLTNDTIVGNECFNGSGCGGGVSVSTAAVADTIIAENKSNEGTLTNCDGTLTITGPDLEDGTECGFTTGGSKQAKPKLGPLADNGGPTETMLPESGSPAIDAGTNATCATHDQRGGVRPAPGGGPCDIGAVEVNSLADLAITGSVSTTSVLAGGAVLYTLRVTDNGPDPALDTTVQNLLPAGATLAGAITSVGSCSGATELTCALGTLKSGASATIDVSAKLTDEGIATDVANVSAPATDPTPANNQTTLTATVFALSPPPLPPAPTLTAVSETHATWRAGAQLATLSRAKRKAPPVGTTFAFTLNTPAHVSLAFTQSVAGRRAQGKCVAQTPKNRRLRACRHTVTSGTLALTGHGGANKVAFQGRISRSQKLRPGRYTVLITATNTAGRSATRALSFTIVR